jgi:hypothetical protein
MLRNTTLDQDRTTVTTALPREQRFELLPKSGVRVIRGSSMHLLHDLPEHEPVHEPPRAHHGAVPLTRCARGLVVEGDAARRSIRARARLSALAESFPSLYGVPGVRPFAPRTLFNWVIDDDDTSTGTRAAVAFLLEVAGERALCEQLPFHVAEALNLWDSAHEAAFLAWTRAPWAAEHLHDVEEDPSFREMRTPWGEAHL